MTRQNAISIGKDQGLKAVMNCKFSYDHDSSPSENVDELVAEACSAEENSRSQSPWGLIEKAINSNPDYKDLWDAYEIGVTMGIADGASQRLSNITNCE